MTAKGIISSTLIAILVCSVAIYSEKLSLRNQKTERTTVIYWEKWTGDEGDEMGRIVDWFNKSQDKIFVKYLAISGVQDKTILATSGGNPPDVAGLWGDQLTSNVDIGELTDLSEMAAASGIKGEDYIPTYWDSCRPYGRLWALPSTPATTAMHVNRALVPEEYKDPAHAPKTIEELDALVDKISIKKDGRIILAGYLPAEPGWWNWGWGYVFGGKMYDGEKFTIDTPENVRAFKWAAGYAKKFGVQETQNFQSGFGSFSSPQNPYLGGKVAMEMQGVWMANFISLYNPKMDWYAAPFPYPADRPDLANLSFAGLDVLAIPKGAKHPKEAFEFIKFVQRQDVMESLCKGHGKNSPLSKVSEDFFKSHKNPYIRLFDSLARTKNTISIPLVGVWPAVTDEMKNSFSEITLGTKTAEQSLHEVQVRVDAIWKRYKEQMVLKK